MNTFKTMVFFSDYDQGFPYLIDTVWHKGHWWLAPPPLMQSLATGEKIPERLICMDGVRVKYQEVQHPEYRFLLTNSIPKSVLDGEERDEYTTDSYPALSHIRVPGSNH